MKSYWKTVLKGFAALLPLVLTVYILFWTLAVLEFYMGAVFRGILGGLYIPGMGIAGGIVLLYAVGRTVERGGALKKLSEFGERQLEKIPVVKTIYGSLRDLTRYFSMARAGGEGARQVVLVQLNEHMRVIGFITGGAADQVGYAPDEEDSVAVYLPMSYQFGGYTVYIPRARIEIVDMSVEEAMQVVLTAGMVRSGRAEKERG